MPITMTCRSCGSEAKDVVLDLGGSPLSNSYISTERLDDPEVYYPLKVYYCAHCHLVQIKAFATPSDIFENYDYFSSFSSTWLEHAKRYTRNMRIDFGIGKDSKVVEIASNDGYLLQYFLADGVDVLGVEPAANVAKAAKAKGIPTHVAFFGVRTARELIAEGHAADLVLGNNVLAHVPDINDFAAGVSVLLKPDGIATFEFPHVLNLLKLNQFDTIYHEHFSYLSLLATQRIFRKAGLRTFDVEELPTHGGSLRVYACLASSNRPASQRIEALLAREKAAELDNYSGYADLREKAERSKADLLSFLLQAKRDRKKVAAYGAAAKGNTFLNYAGIKPDLLPYIADLNPHKQGKYLPGSHIPIIAPDELLQSRPDYVLIMPWNISDEIMQQLTRVRSWGGRFVTAIPNLKVIP